MRSAASRGRCRSAKPGQPEPQGPCAPQRRQQVVLGSAKGANSLVALKERVGSFTLVPDTPVVQTHRDVEQQHVAAGKIEVEYPCHPFALEQDVVPEEVTMHGATRELGECG